MENAEIINETKYTEGNNALQAVSNIVTTFEDTKGTLNELVKKYENVKIDKDNKKQIESAEKDLRQHRYKIQSAEKLFKSKLNNVKKYGSDKFNELYEIIKPHEDKFREPLDQWKAEIEAEKLRLEKIEQDRKDNIIQTIKDFESDYMAYINECKTSDEVSKIEIALPDINFQEFESDANSAVSRVKDHKMRIKYNLILKEDFAKKEAELKAREDELRKKEAELKAKAKAKDESIKQEFLPAESLINEPVNETEVELPLPSEKPINEVIQESKDLFPEPDQKAYAQIEIVKIADNYFLNFTDAKLLIDINEMPFSDELNEWCQDQFLNTAN